MFFHFYLNLFCSHFFGIDGFIFEIAKIHQCFSFPSLKRIRYFLSVKLFTRSFFFHLSFFRPPFFLVKNIHHAAYLYLSKTICLQFSKRTFCYFYYPRGTLFFIKESGSSSLQFQEKKK